MLSNLSKFLYLIIGKKSASLKEYRLIRNLCLFSFFNVNNMYWLLIYWNLGLYFLYLISLLFWKSNLGYFSIVFSTFEPWNHIYIWFLYCFIKKSDLCMLFQKSYFKILVILNLFMFVLSIFYITPFLIFVFIYVCILRCEAGVLFLILLSS